MKVAVLVSSALLLLTSAHAYETYVCVGSGLADVYDVEVFASAAPEFPKLSIYPYAEGALEPLEEEMAYPPARTRVARDESRLEIRGVVGLFSSTEASLEIDFSSPAAWAVEPRIFDRLGDRAPKVREAYRGSLLIDDGSPYDGEAEVVCGRLESRD